MNDGTTIKGEWEVKELIKKDEDNKVNIIKLDNEINVETSKGSNINIDGYSRSNVSFKLYGNIDNTASEVILLKGVDNLGNEVIMYPRFKGDKEVSFNFYDGPSGMTNNRLNLSKDISSLRLRVYEEKYINVSGKIVSEEVGIGEEFEININLKDK
ncbi:MAG: hypothetical protein ACRC7N_17565 [Clostridium sp.]